MASIPGTPIWYELLTTDPAAARTFYEAVTGWTVEAEPAPGAGAVQDYRLIAAADGPVAGMFTLRPAMLDAGARPAWMIYFGVADVDAEVAAMQAAGGRSLLPAFDIPGIGRIAMVADPQGAPFYVMRGTGAGDSHAWAPEVAGHGAWHELLGPDATAALAFYGARFGWREVQRVDLPGGDVYRLFGHAPDRPLGGMMTMAVPQPAWNLYFRADGIEAAAARIAAAGGKVLHGPMEVPDGSWIVMATDPQGASFGLTGTR